MVHEDGDDAFAIPDLWKPPRWLDLSPPGQSEFFGLDIRAANKATLVDTGNDLAAVISDEFFKVPATLEALPLDGGNDHDHNDVPAEDSQQNARWRDVDLFNDLLVGTDAPPSYPVEYKTWDGFSMPDIPSVEPLFLTEAGPSAFDAALKSSEDPLGIGNKSHNIVEVHPYITALLALSLGRASIFFTWDERSGSFTQDLDGLRISGYTTDVLKGLQARCQQCGNISRFLHVFVQITYRTHPSTARVALAKAVDTLLLAIQTKLGYQARKISSLLQLQSMIRPVHTILAYFHTLITRLNKARTDEQILSMLFEENQALEDGDELLGDIMREILARVSEPWAEFVRKWIGVKPEEANPITKDGPGKSFVSIDNVAYTDDFGLEVAEPDFILDERRIPSFLPEDMAQTMFETGRNLRLLRIHHPEHPLCRLELIRSKPPPHLGWHYSWTAIELLQRDVEEYETSTLHAIRHRSSGPKTEMLKNTAEVGYSLKFFGHEEKQLAEHIMASIQELSQPPTALGATDRLSQLLHDRLFENEQGKEQGKEQSELTLTPHWSLLPLLSFGPLIEAQARLVNRECMKLLFTSHQIRDHIALQKEFHLLGNGFFCSSLSHALFDPELETAERQAGVARSGGAMGLRLGSRDTWPPASSELRLALMGVLTESYLPLTQRKQSPGSKAHGLPGDLSFAVRDLPEEEIEKCMDPGSLEALDFLRLSYKPPAQLAPVFTPVILVKYDKIFRMLLRVLRLLYVTGELYRDTNGRTSRWTSDDISLRFRFEAQHFVASITAYFFDTGIHRPWSRFEGWLDQVKSEIDNERLISQNTPVTSVDGLRERHEQVLDQIMHTLLLRKRQQPVLKVLEDIFTLILKYSKVARVQARGVARESNDSSSAAQLYRGFKKKVDVFMTVCRGLSERQGQGTKTTRHDWTTDTEKPGSKEENTIDQLLLQLEMSGYYGGPRY